VFLITLCKVHSSVLDIFGIIVRNNTDLYLSLECF